MDLYRDLILDHYKHPRNFGHLEKPDVVMEEGNVTCGDRIIIELLIAYRLSLITIRDIRFSGEGCAISQASASMLTEKVKGMSVAQVQKLSRKDIEDMLGTTLTPSRVKCATLPLEVLQKAMVSLKPHAR
ncbi:SUF system NifU family Fe-S cluster assembly protein [Candidatus Gottesmanbacteria bacterium]|nr:SUF system NifU family Fe-S cluster assembly protein [Candidatus Gottesmanbacteria bacterium]